MPQPSSGSQVTEQARELAWIGQHAAAITSCTQALAATALSAAERLDLLDIRAESYIALGQLDQAAQDADAMATCAKGEPDPALMAQALNRLARVQLRAGDLSAAAQTAERALGMEHAAPQLRAQSYLYLSEAQRAAARYAAAVDSAHQAVARYEELGDLAGAGRAYGRLAQAQDALGHHKESHSAACTALELCQRAGDQYGISIAIYALIVTDKDMLERIQHLQLLASAFEKAGYTEDGVLSRRELGRISRELGLYAPARRLYRELADIYRSRHASPDLCVSLTNSVLIDIELHDLGSAHTHRDELASIVPGLDNSRIDTFLSFCGGYIAFAEGDFKAAVQHMNRAAQVAHQIGYQLESTYLAYLGAFYLADGQRGAALQATARAAAIHRAHSFAKPEGSPSQLIWWMHAQALLANQQTNEARTALDQAYDLLLEAITNLRDVGLRRTYLNKVVTNRDFLRYWVTDGMARGLPKERIFAHLPIESNPREPFRRLTDTGLRLNALHSVAAIQTFLVEAATELSGGERVLLILEQDGQRAVAASILPLPSYFSAPRDAPAEDPATILSGIAEYLDHARRTRSVQLTRPTQAGLCRIVAPLITQNQLLGYLYVDVDPLYGSFDETDRDMLGMLANQAAVALDNARWAQGLEHKVAERTEQLQAANIDLEQRNAEIQRQKEFSEALIEASPVAIVQSDMNLTITGWNPGAERLFGYTSAEAMGRHIDDLVANRPEIREDAERYGPAHYDGSPFHAIVQRTRKDGQLVDVELLSVPVTVRDEVVAAITIYHDITELNQARQAAIAANEAKSAFLATMSHEIRTPMNGIIGMTGLLLNTPLSPDQQEFAETIRSSADALLTIINDILDFSKIESGKLDLEQQPFDLRDCVESALDLVAARAAEKQLDLAYTIDATVPPALVGDVTRLRQILLNLLSNAVKFTEHGEVVVDVRREGLREGLALPETLRFSVRDTGIGIPPAGLARLFQSFSQVDTSTTRKYGGTGLGLAISKRLAELMGGELWVESTVGVGTTFYVTIAAAAAPPLKARPHLDSDAPALAGKRVLVVDDNTTNRRILSLQLARWGMLVRDTPAPQEALAWVRNGTPFDLGILDMLMPELDGLALAGELRALRSAETLPLLLWSSLGRREGLEGGLFAAQLSKPLKPSQLFDTLSTLFAGEAVAPLKKAAPAQATDPSMAARHPLRILLAEDNAVNQKLALRLLGQMGYRADLAGNGLEAVAAIERQPYDLILMDVQMPELDGLEATRQIRARALAAGQPHIVAMTANAMQGDRELCIAAGMDDYIAKPIKVDELVDALERARPLARP